MKNQRGRFYGSINKLIRDTEDRFDVILTGVSEEEERKDSRGNNETIMAKDFPTVFKDANIQIQDTQNF